MCIGYKKKKKKTGKTLEIKKNTRNTQKIRMDGNKLTDRQIGNKITMPQKPLHSDYLTNVRRIKYCGKQSSC